MEYGRSVLRWISHGDTLQRNSSLRIALLIAYLAFPQAQLCCLRSITVLCPAPTPSGLACALTQEGLSSSVIGCPCVQHPIRRRVLGGCAFQVFTADYEFHGLRPIPRGSAPSWPPLGGKLTTRQISLNATDHRFARLPYRRLCQRASTPTSLPEPPLSYSAAGTLPRPDFHRQVDHSLLDAQGSVFRRNMQQRSTSRADPYGMTVWRDDGLAG